MQLTLTQLTKDLTKIDFNDILSCWQWQLVDMKQVITVSCLGDLFLIGNDDGIYWLQTDEGKLSKVADSMQLFEQLIDMDENIENWFLPLLIEKLIMAGKVLKENEVYSYKKIPVIGGEYSVDNIEPTDISVHFAFSGQICEQIKDLPDGTKVSVKYQSYPDSQQE